MVVIQIWVGKNFIDDVVIDGGSKINSIIESMRIQLGLSKPNLVLYNLRMAHQTTWSY